MKCSQTHRGGHFGVLPGEAYVLKSKDKIFTDPHANLNFAEPRIISDWISSQKPLNEWANLLKAADHQENKDKVDQGNFVQENDIENKQSLKSNLIKHKTPYKPKMSMNFDEKVDLDIVKRPTTARKLTSIMEEATDDPTIASTILQESFEHIDMKINNLFSMNNAIKDQLDKVSEREHIKSMTFQAKYEDLVATVGFKPTNITEDYDTPTLWSTVSEVITKFQDSNSFQRLEDHVRQLT